MNRLSAWSVVFRKSLDRLSNRKAKTLSVGGRITLINSILGDIPTYYMSLFKAPKAILNKLEALRNRFFVGVDVEEKKMMWVAWKQLMASKENGGLGVNSLFALNRGLLFK